MYSLPKATNMAEVSESETPSPCAVLSASLACSCLAVFSRSCSELTCVTCSRKRRVLVREQIGEGGEWD